MISKIVKLILFSCVFFLLTFPDQDVAFSKAIRPDASTFTLHCNDCCDTDNVTDCQFNEARSLLEVIISDIDALASFDETCCSGLNSKLDALTTFEETCCVELNSKIDAILDCSCCEYMITQADIGSGDTYIITAPGVYCLAEDVTFSTSGFAIQINNTEPEVILDLQGHTITGSGSGSAIFVTNTSYGTTIQNGSTNNTGTGIQVQDATQLFIKNLNIASSVNYGITVETISGDSGGIDIIDTFIRNTGIDGIYISNAAVTRIIDSTIVVSGQAGVHINGCFQSDIENVRVINTQTYGFQVSSTQSSANAVYFKNCVAEACMINGFAIISDINNGVGVVGYTDCKSFGNNGDGFIVSSGGSTIESIEYKSCLSKANNGNGFSTGLGTNISKLLYIDCIAELDQANGFFIDCFDGLISSCIAKNNKNDGIHLDVNASNCQVLNNTLVQNQVFGINDLGSGNLIYSNIANANPTNYSPSVPLQLLPTDITGYWINVDPTASAVGEYESKIDALLNCNCCPNLITQADIDTGNYTITAPGVYCLASNVTLSSGNGITISGSAPQVELDLQGYTIQGGPSSGIAILVTNVTDALGEVVIKNGAINGCKYGIVVNESQSVLIKDMQLSNMQNQSIQISFFSVGIVIDNVEIISSGDDGIHVSQSQDVEIRNSYVIQSGRHSNGSGIIFDGSSDCIVQNVLTNGNQQFGFRVDSSNGPSSFIVFDNCSDQYSVGGGFGLTSPYGFVRSIRYNSCRSYSDPGIISTLPVGFSCVAINNGQISDVEYQACSSSTNFKGFVASGLEVYGIVYDDCIAFGNIQDGFVLDCAGSIVRSSIAENNGIDGIKLGLTSSNCQVLSCSTLNNGNIGINDIGTAGTNIVYSNTAVGNTPNYSPTVPLQLKPTDITGHWINVDPTASVIGEYESKIDAILSCSCCENVITQEMINAGQVVLTESGIYCLADDIVSSANIVPIVISNTVGEIILDLGGHSIVDSNINTAILISNSTGGVTIRNGTISQVVNGIIVTNNSSHIIIENVIIYNTSDTSILIQQGSSDVFIDRVSIKNSGSDGISFQESQALTNFSFYIKDTSIVKSAKSGVHMNGTFTAILENVHAIDNGAYGFCVESVSDISQGISYKNCYAEYNKLAGFVLVTSTGLPLATISYQDCQSFNNEGPGYSILGSSGTILALSYNNCTAMCNSSHGFSTGTGSSGSLVHDIIYNNCISQLNRGNGFYIDCQGSAITHCCSNGNGRAGILLDRNSFKWQIIDSIIGSNKNNGIEVYGSSSLIQRCSVCNNVGSGIIIFSGSQNIQILNSYLSQNSSYGINNSGTGAYIFGNNAVFNASGNFNPPIGLPLTNTSTYWANVRDPLVA